MSQVEAGLDQEKYLVARKMALLPLVYGERGVVVARSCKYFRWVDNAVDNNCEATKEQKLSFLERQKQIVVGNIEPEDIHELEFSSLPWNIFGKDESTIRSKSLIILSSIEDDTVHQGFIPRTYKEIRHNIWRSTLAAVENMCLVLNQKSNRTSKHFADLIFQWHYLGSLHDLKEDIDAQMLQVGFTETEKENIIRLQNIDDRKSLVLKIYDKDRFEREKRYHLESFKKLASSAIDLDIPLWQKLSVLLYMNIRQPVKLEGMVNYPFNFDTTNKPQLYEASSI